MRSGTALAIETTGLIKRFGSNTAVDGVDLAVPTGGVYGVLGPNGAGKTTTIRMLATLLPIDGGSARVLGHVALYYRPGELINRFALRLEHPIILYIGRLDPEKNVALLLQAFPERRQGFAAGLFGAVVFGAATASVGALIGLGIAVRHHAAADLELALASVIDFSAAM